MTAATCSVGDCGHAINPRARRSGLCERHYFQKVKGRPFTPHPATTPDRQLWQRLAKGDPDDCWEYPGARDRDGYGQVPCCGKQYKAHRVAWESANGPIPVGMMVCHSCDNPPCCNPAHLFLGSNADNMADCAAKGRNPRGERSGMAKLTEDDVRTIRAEFATSTLVELADRFGVSRTTIQFVVNRKTWRHVA